LVNLKKQIRYYFDVSSDKKLLLQDVLKLIDNYEDWQIEQLRLIGLLCRMDWSGHIFDGKDVKAWINRTIEGKDIREDLNQLKEGY